MLRKFVIVIVIVIVLLGVYYGIYLPWCKSVLYNATNRMSGMFRTLAELEENYDKLFQFKSPVGQEEVVKFFVNSVLSTVANNKVDEPISRGVTEYIEQYASEDSFVHQLHLGYIYDVLWQRFGAQAYFDKAEEYYRHVYEIGPHVPHAPHALFKMYKNAGQIEKMQELGEQILELWPSDESTRAVLESVN